jgi:hypothetical protein
VRPLGHHALVPEAGQKLSRGMTLGSADGLRVVILAEPTVPGALEYDGLTLANCRPVPCSLSGRPPGVAHVNRSGTCYSDPGSGLELLCVQGGDGELSYQGRALRPVLGTRNRARGCAGSGAAARQEGASNRQLRLETAEMRYNRD